MKKVDFQFEKRTSEVNDLIFKSLTNNLNEEEKQFLKQFIYDVVGKEIFIDKDTIYNRAFCKFPIESGIGTACIHAVMSLCIDPLTEGEQEVCSEIIKLTKEYKDENIIIKKRFPLPGNAYVETMEEQIAILKNDLNSKEEYRNYLLMDDEILSFDEIWERVKPISLKEILLLNNETLKMAAMTFVNPERFVTELKGKVLAIESFNKEYQQFIIPGENLMSPIIKKDMMNKGNIKFKDTYVLYEIPKQSIGINEPMFIVECTCITTKNKYYLEVEPPQPDDTPIDCMRRRCFLPQGGNPTREEYLAMQIES